MAEALTVDQLDAIVGHAVDRTNAISLIQALELHPAGLDRPHRRAQFLGQVLHESGRLKFATEIWGPTAAQRRYERDPASPWTRDDPRNRVAFSLENTQPGDGSKFRGRGLIQLTGRGNARRFTAWCLGHKHACPDFEVTPEALATPPWSGLCAVSYWDEREINRYADTGNDEAVTRAINGALNGYTDRTKLYTRTALVMLGLKPTDVRAFQASNPPLDVDGIAGKETRAALHRALSLLWAPPLTLTTTERLDLVEARLDVLEAKEDLTNG